MTNLMYCLHTQVSLCSTSHLGLLSVPDLSLVYNRGVPSLSGTA